METRQFKLVKNMLWPFPTTIEVGPAGITNKGKLVPWSEISRFSYTVTEINGALNYVILYHDASGARNQINYVVTLLGSTKKKKLCAELYDSLREGFIAHHIEPRTRQYLAKIEAGESVTLKSLTVSKRGVEMDLGRKGKILVPSRDVRMSHRNTGGFRVSSATDDRASTYVELSLEESRCLLELLNRLYPDQAQDLN